MSELRKYLDMIPADVKLFLKGLVAAAINSAAVVAFAFFMTPTNYTAEALKTLPGILLGAMVGGVALYFRKSPVPEWRFDRAVEKGQPPPERRKSAGRGEFEDTPV